MQVFPSQHGDRVGGKTARLYSIWKGMKQRCEYKRHRWYKCYGGKGITVCPAWSLSYNAFKNWAMNHGYQDHLTLDRIDSNGHYEPSNCRWIAAHINYSRRNTSPTAQH